MTSEVTDPSASCNSRNINLIERLNDNIPVVLDDGGVGLNLMKDNILNECVDFEEMPPTSNTVSFATLHLHDDSSINSRLSDSVSPLSLQKSKSRHNANQEDELPNSVAFASDERQENCFAFENNLNPKINNNEAFNVPQDYLSDESTDQMGDVNDNQLLPDDVDPKVCIINGNVKIKQIPQSPKVRFKECLKTNKNLPTSNQVVKKKYACDVCPKRYDRKSTLVQHQRVHTRERPFICNICEKRFVDNGTLTCHIRTHITGEKFVCNVCNKAFPTKKNLLRHQCSHAGAKTFVCDVCQKAFKHNRDLINHRTIHSDEKPFSCEVCQKSYHSYIALRKHFRGVHCAQKTKKFVCEICSKVFMNRRSLTDHGVTHTGDKPFSCNICEKKFMRLSGLYRHRRTHTGEKPFMCDHCQKRFATRYHLTVHANIHSAEVPYACEVCERRFRNEKMLNMHFQIHTDDRPHVCNICQEKFTRKSSLRNHIKRHANQECASNVSIRSAVCDVLLQSNSNSVITGLI